MNRRQMLVSALSTSVLAMPLPALAASSRVVWAPGTRESRHALLAARNIHHVLSEGLLYTTSDLSGMGYKIELRDPRIIVGHDDIMFHPTRGFRYEDALTVEFHERGQRIGEAMMYSNGATTRRTGRSPSRPNAQTTTCARLTRPTATRTTTAPTARFAATTGR